MKLEFDFSHVKIVEFGVEREVGKDQDFCLVPVDVGVQNALVEMAIDTWKAMNKLTVLPPPYDPSEKYESLEYVVLRLEDDLATHMRDLRAAANLPSNSNALSDPSSVLAYFARLTDYNGGRLTGLRRAAQFKGVLSSRLIRLLSDAYRIVEDRIFKLDSDFDLMIDANHVHILRPSGFEFTGGVQKAVLQAVPKNIALIEVDLPFVDFAGISDYAGKHPRAARYLASIRSQAEARNVDETALKTQCEKTGVEIQVVNGKLTVSAGHEMGFLEVLDRRLFQVELVKATPERFRAPSRRKIDGSGFGSRGGS